jgi:regulator of RNase E activity RraA
MRQFSSLRERFLALATPEVSDALEFLGAGGGLAGIRSVVPGQKVFGPAFTVARVWNHDPGYRRAGDFLDQVPAGHVVVIDNLGLETCTCWGGILTLYARKHAIEGTVINGMYRDVDVVRNAAYPVFARGVFMVTGRGRTRVGAINVPVTIQGVSVSAGDYVFGDDHGVVVIPARILEDVADRAEMTRAIEADILDLITRNGISLSEARERLNYHSLTAPAHTVPSQSGGAQAG